MIDVNRRQRRDKPLRQLVPQLVLKVERDDTNPLIVEVCFVECPEQREDHEVVVDSVHTRDGVCRWEQRLVEVAMVFGQEVKEPLHSVHAATLLERTVTS